VHVVCNTSDEQIFANIKANSAAYGDWLKQADAHDRTAVICGSGPSIAEPENIAKIRNLYASGAANYALNGAAKFLNDIGILPDYQVLIDARQETASLVGNAKTHLFASQVHPKCFDGLESVKLWHLQVEGIDDYLPECEGDICFIGGAASVGNTATCLAYAMGFRNLVVFGLDSSNKPGSGAFGQSHVIHQSINDGEPMASVKFGGKDYICSLTMKLQAERFQETAKELKTLGCSIAVHGYGLLPDMYNSPHAVLSEYEKYKTMWNLPQYREYSPGEQIAGRIIDILQINGRDAVIDFGCGTGRAALAIRNATDCEILALDFAENSLDREAGQRVGIYFKQQDLTKPLMNYGESESVLTTPTLYVSGCEKGYCTDVMEHIPPEQVDLVITNIMEAASKVVFQISLVPDVCGALIGQDLHLSVHPAAWWHDTFIRLGHSVELVEESADKSTCIFYVVRG